jgi:CubicO group peptidase (beta-lactamase class C family)
MAQATRRAWTTAELVAVVRSAPAKSAPGERWEYNNSGYMMLVPLPRK